MFSLKGKNIIITGAGSGIGLAIANTLAAQGARVLIFDRDEASAEQAKEMVNSLGFEAEAFVVDVTDLNKIETTIAFIEDLYPIDILINNAGIGHIGTAQNTSPEDLDKVYTINVKGYYHMIHCILPYMMGRNQGIILNIASVAGTVGIAERFAYSTSKGAVLAMTRSVAKDYVHHGIRCNSISPGRVHTPFVDGYLAKNYPGRENEIFEKLAKTQPIGRMGEPTEIASLALYLCSDEASFVTGTDFPIDGGFIKLNT